MQKWLLNKCLLPQQPPQVQWGSCHLPSTAPLHTYAIMHQLHMHLLGSPIHASFRALKTENFENCRPREWSPSTFTAGTVFLVHSKTEPEGCSWTTVHTLLRVGSAFLFEKHEGRKSQICSYQLYKKTLRNNIPFREDFDWTLCGNLGIWIFPSRNITSLKKWRLVINLVHFLFPWLAEGEKTLRILPQ